MKLRPLLPLWAALTLGLGVGLSSTVRAEHISQWGAWYAYNFDGRFSAESPWGYSGEFLWQSFDLGADFRQLYLRGQMDYRFADLPLRLALGYGYLFNSPVGEGTASPEDRIHFEASYPQPFFKNWRASHRFRAELRWIENVDFRSRFRYRFMVNVPLDQKEMGLGGHYLSFFDEIFFNGETRLDSGQTFDALDQNRLYLGWGYGLFNDLSSQIAVMLLSSSVDSQMHLFVSLHHSI